MLPRENQGRAAHLSTQGQNPGALLCQMRLLKMPQTLVALLIDLVLELPGGTQEADGASC